MMIRDGKKHRKPNFMGVDQGGLPTYAGSGFQTSDENSNVSPLNLTSAETELIFPDDALSIMLNPDAIIMIQEDGGSGWYEFESKEELDISQLAKMKIKADTTAKCSFRIALA